MPLFSELSDSLYGTPIESTTYKFAKCLQKRFGVIEGMKHTKGMNAVRRTVNSKIRCAGVSATVAASLLGHTEEVNQQNDTYDITKIDYKREVVKKIIENLKGNQDDNEIKRNKNLDKSMFSAL